mmetsp:Transcript_26768/g.56197  ORF Transcript_26768/g.56197 Transcript_26768/m.56197 type:complete len:577 (+) Transcript_26768:186-1916(+)
MGKAQCAIKRGISGYPTALAGNGQAHGLKAQAPQIQQPRASYLRRARSMYSTPTLPQGQVTESAFDPNATAISIEDADEPEIGHLYMSCAKKMNDGRGHWLRSPVNSGVDAAMLSSVRRVTRMMGNLIANGLKDPTNPTAEHIVMAFWRVWNNLSAFIELEFLEQHSHKRKWFRKALLKRRSVAPSFWRADERLPQPFTWLRARVLYALFPADNSMSPAFVVFLVVALMPLYGVEIWAYALVFLMIDKRDDFQLINFTCLFKTVQFIACGIYPAIAQSVEHFVCLTYVHASQADKCAGMPENMRLQFAAEPVRYTVIWASYCLLLCGYAYGGPENATALEAVRVDLADGKLDGVHAVPKRLARNRLFQPFLPRLRSGASKTKSARSAEPTRALHASAGRSARKGESADVLLGTRDTAAGDGAPGAAAVHDEVEVLVEPPSLRTVARAHRGARIAAGAKRSYGGIFGYFIAYDVLNTLVVVAGAVAVIFVNGYRAQDWIIWEVFELAREVQSLLSFPFILFANATLLRLLTGTIATGYDVSGILCQQLTPAQLQMLDKMAGKNAKANGANRAEGSAS